MRRFRWLPWLSSSVVALGTGLLLSPAALKADPPDESKLDESKVTLALMQPGDYVFRASHSIGLVLSSSDANYVIPSGTMATNTLPNLKQPRKELRDQRRI